jgi:hypothetical protein
MHSAGHEAMSYSVRLVALRSKSTRVLIAIAAASMLVNCAAMPTVPTPTATVAPTHTATPRVSDLHMPKGYMLPTDCRYIDGGTVDGSATTWKISCPQGLPSNYLRPSLTAQGWVSCGAKVWQKNGLQIAVTDAVNVSGFAGWLDQRPLSGASCTQPTPPPNGSAGPP